MRYDTLVSGGELITESGPLRADVAIRDGTVAALLAPGHGAAARERIEAAGQLVLPGAIDIHFHCRAPAWPQRGDFASETRAAAAGGVTAIFEMPVSKPCCATVEVFRRRRALAEADACVDFGLYAAPGLLERDEVQAMAAEGAIAFKIFMTAAPAGRDDEFEGLCLTERPQQLQALQLVAETGRVCVVHAEDNDLLEWHTAQLQAAGRADLGAHPESRPVHVEMLAIATLLILNQQAGARLHIAHVSSAGALAVLGSRGPWGGDVSAETCPHYLFFTREDYMRLGAWAKVNPPLREQFDQDALWQALREDMLLAVTTDHSPFTAGEKDLARSDIWRVPPGAPGVEELVPAMLDAALSGRIDITQAVRLISTNGARRFGIYPQKGAILPGADADLVLYDPTAETVIRRETLFSRSRDSDRLYEGRRFRGRVTRTMLRGTTVYVDGEVTGARGGGRFLRPGS